MSSTAGWERTDGIAWKVGAGFRTQHIQNEGNTKDVVFSAEIKLLLAGEPLKVIALSFLPLLWLLVPTVLKLFEISGCDRVRGMGELI